MEELDIFIDQFYGKYSPNDIPQGDRRTRLKEKLRSDFDGYVGQMYSKYAPDNLPDATRINSLKTKYLGNPVQNSIDQQNAVSEIPAEELAKRNMPEATALDYANAGAGAFNRGISQLVSVPLKFEGALEQSLGVKNPIQELTELTGLTDESDLPWATQAGDAVEGFMNKMNPRYENVNQTYQDVGQGLGQGVGMIATGLGATNAGLQASNLAAGYLPATGRALGEIGKRLLTPTAFLGGAMTATPEWDAAKKAGLSDEDAFEVLLKNYAVGQTEALPIQNLLSRLNRATGNQIVNTAKAMGTGSLEEFAQEGIQTYLTNETAKDSYDPNRDPMFQVLQSAKVGGIVGFLLPGMVSFARSLPVEKRVKLETKLAEISADDAIKESDTGDPQMNAEIDAVAQIDPVDKQVFEEIKITDAVQSEQKETEAEEKLQEDLQPVKEETVEKELKPSQTPEYKQAVAKVEDLQRKFSELSIDENADELLFDLREARQALQKIAGKAKDTRPKTDIQKQIEDTTGVTKPEKSIKMTPNEAIKFRVQEFYKGVQEGVYRGKDASNELVNKVQEAIKESPLSTKQVNSILTRVKKTNLFTPGSISRLNSFIDKVTQDATYADQLSQIEDVNSDVKKSLKKATPKEKSSLQIFAALEGEDVATPETHITLGNLIKQSNKPVASKDHVPLNLESVNSYLEDATNKLYTSEFGKAPVNLTPEQRYNEVQRKRTEDRREERLNKVAEDLGLNFEDRKLLLESDTEVEDAISDQNKREKVKEELVNIAKTVGTKLKTVETEHTDILEKIKKVNPDNLSINDLKKYIEVVDRITENNDFGGSQEVAAIGAAEAGFDTLTPKIGKHIIGLTGIEADYTASLSQAFKSIFGLSEDAALFQEYSGIKGISDAHAYSVDEGQAVADMMNDLHEKFDKLYGSKRNGFTTDSIYRQGIYRTLIKHDAVVDGDEFLRTKGKKAIETTIQSYKEVGDSDEAKLVEGLYEPFKNVQTIKEAQEVMERIDPAGKKVFDAVVEWYKKYKPEVNKYNETGYSDFSQDIENYAGETNVKKLGSAPVDTESAYTPGTLKPKRLDSSKRFTGNVPTGSVVDLNFHVGVVNHVEELAFDLKANPYILQVNAFAKQKEKVLGMFGYDKNKPDTKKAAEDLYTKIFDKNSGIYKSFLDDSQGTGTRRSKTEQNIAKSLTAVHKLVYTASLSGITQAPKQYTVLASTAINLGKNAPMVATSIVEISRDKKGFQSLIKGESVSTRGKEASIVNLGDWFDASEVLKTESSVKSFFSRDFPTVIDKKFNSWWGGLKTLITTDASAAQISWLSYYRDFLTTKGEKFLGFDEENKLRDTPNRREARAYAKQRVDETQVSSNPAELAQAAKTRTVAGQLAKAQFMPFGSFNLSKKQRLSTNAKIIVFGTDKQRKEATLDTAAAYAETLAFIAVRRLIQATWGAAITLGIREFYNLDDPEDDEEKKKRRTREFAQDVTEFLVDIIPTTLLAADPVKKGLIDSVEQLIYWWYKQDNPDLTKSEFKDETGLDLRPRQTTPLTDYFGNYGIVGDNVVSGIQMANESFNSETLSEEQKRLASLAAALQFGSFGLVPADLRNPVLTEYRKQKKDSKDTTPSNFRPRPRPRIIRPN